MKGIVGHWTGGGPTPNARELRAYHGLVDQDNRRHDGDYAPEANRDTSDGKYARHAGGFNTGMIGLSVCGMLDAQERPFDPGPHPITRDRHA